MSTEGAQPVEASNTLIGPEKAPTGIVGFDEITSGGLPKGRPTLVTGAAGAGKTLFGIEFLVRGARDCGEPGVLLAFEEVVDVGSSSPVVARRLDHQRPSTTLNCYAQAVPGADGQAAMTLQAIIAAGGSPR